MTQWDEKGMAAVLAAAIELATPVKSTRFIGQRGEHNEMYSFAVTLRNGQESLVDVQEKGK